MYDNINDISLLITLNNLYDRVYITCIIKLYIIGVKYITNYH